MRTKGAYANKEDCKNCESNIGGRCKTLVETNWIIKNCPFVATEERLQRDREILIKAINDGRVKPSDQ